jgi:DNA-binding transcriptional MerR regulator
MQLLAPQDAGRRLRLSTSRLAQLDRDGVLPAIRDSAGRRLYDADVVERFALERAQKRTAQVADDVPQPVES